MKKTKTIWALSVLSAALLGCEGKFDDTLTSRIKTPGYDYSIVLGKPGQEKNIIGTFKGVVQGLGGINPIDKYVGTLGDKNLIISYNWEHESTDNEYGINGTIQGHALEVIPALKGLDRVMRSNEDKVKEYSSDIYTGNY